MSASPTTYGWIAVPTNQVATSQIYRFVVLAPTGWTAAQTQAYLDPDLGGSVGWNVKSISVPPANVAAALQAAGVVFPGGQIPVAWWVTAEWPGTPGVLPTDPKILYEQLSVYTQVPPGTPDDSTSPTPPEPTDYSWVPWALGAAALIAGVYVLGRRAETEESMAGHVFGRRYARNPIQTLNVTVNGRSLPFVVETDNGVQWTASTKVGRKRIVSSGQSKSEALQSAIALASSTLASAGVRSSY